MKSRVLLPPTELRKTADDILKVIDRAIPVHGDRRPEIGRGGSDYTWHYTKEHYWTEAFWPGTLWLAYRFSGDERYKAAAEAQIPAFDRILATPRWIHHDVGFLFLMSSVSDFTMTGSEAAKARALRAADALRSRFQWHGRFIQAWNPKQGDDEWNKVAVGKMIIDSMENIHLLYWASRVTGEASFADIATEHALTMQRHIIREDGSTFHCFDFDPVTGAPVGGSTHQGWSKDSCWSRGQAWAVHGFCQTYFNTGEMGFLETASRLADYVTDHLPEDGVPLWDFAIPSEAPRVRDSSAGAILAAGILSISRAWQGIDSIRAEHYSQAGIGMISGLRTFCDITGVDGALGFLNQGASHAKKGGYWASAMLSYGDYYYLEAVLRSLGCTDFFWTAGLDL